MELYLSGEAEKRKLLEITERGREHLEEQGTEVKHEGRGGVVHRYWQHLIKDLFEEAGWTAKTELFDADVYVNLDGPELVVEVAMENAPREVEHVQAHVEQGFDHVWVACRNEEVRDGMKKRLEEKDLLDERVAIRLFRDFSSDEKPQI